MTIKNFSMASFYKPWEGAVDTWNKIVDADKVDELENFIDEFFPDGFEDVTDLNDFIWFDSELILSTLGIADEDDEDDEEEDEEE